MGCRGRRRIVTQDHSVRLQWLLFDNSSQRHAKSRTNHQSRGQDRPPAALAETNDETYERQGNERTISPLVVHIPQPPSLWQLPQDIRKHCQTRNVEDLPRM